MKNRQSIKVQKVRLFANTFWMQFKKESMDGIGHVRTVMRNASISIVYRQDISSEKMLQR